jgi:type III pantothenate kinase
VARAIEALARQRVACCELLVPVASACGVANGYAEPARLGADRWAALIGAHVSGPAGEDKLVALAGTALTLDALDAEGRHWGGLIVPGADLMRDALARRTADLRPGAQRAASPIALGADWPRDTAAAIAAGLDAALGGALLRLHERMRARAGRAPVVVLAGGDAKRLAAQLPFRCIIDDNLVFNGLRALANRSQPPGP